MEGIKKMVSYKALYEEMKKKYEEQVEFSRKSVESEYKCPLCGSILLESLDEFYCSNENCTFDKVFGDLVYFYANHNDLERVD